MPLHHLPAPGRGPALDTHAESGPGTAAVMAGVNSCLALLVAAVLALGCVWALSWLIVNWP